VLIPPISSLDQNVAVLCFADKALRPRALRNARRIIRSWPPVKGFVRKCRIRETLVHTTSSGTDLDSGSIHGG